MSKRTMKHSKFSREQIEITSNPAYPNLMNKNKGSLVMCIRKLSIQVVAYSIFPALLSLSPQAKAEDTGISCEHIPVLAGYLLKTHVLIKTQSDEVNKHTIDQMIKRLDNSKILLLQSDVDDLSAKLLNFLQNMKNPDCKNIDSIKILLVQRAKDQLEFAKSTLGESYKLDESAEIQLDPDKRAYPKTTEESRKRQLVQLHFQISNYLASDIPLKKAKEKLVHRYELSVKAMENLNNHDFYNYMVNAFASALDPHSVYSSPEEVAEFRINMGLSLEGIGASLSSEDGYTVIQELIPGGAAYKSKLLQPKDKIIAVGQGANGEMEDVIDTDLKNVVKRIRGKAGTTVKLAILRETPSLQRLSITLVRSKVQLEDEAAKLEFFNRTVDGKKYKLARIELPAFYGGQSRSDRSSYTDMLRAVEKANKEGADGIVLDLSQNGGGLLEDSVKIAGLFINRGSVVATKDSAGNIQPLDDYDNKVQFAGPLVVLISRLSASASEIVAGALQDYGRAIIVGGDHTYGKGTVQAVVPLDAEYGHIRVTTGIFYIPGGNSTQHRGVSSDITFPNIFSTDDIGEKRLDYSLKPDAIPRFVSPEANEEHLWTPVAKEEVEKLKLLSQQRVAKSKEFAEIIKETKEIEERKDLIKLSDLRKKDSESKKKNKDKAPKQIAKEKNKPQIEESLAILADFVHLRKASGSHLVSDQKLKAKASKN